MLGGEIGIKETEKEEASLLMMQAVAEKQEGISFV
jgi:hypothetical protein